MPYADLEKRRANAVLRSKRYRLKHPNKVHQQQMNYLRSTEGNRRRRTYRIANWKRCSVEGCEEKSTRSGNCASHTVKATVSDKKMYQSIKTYFQRRGIIISGMPEDLVRLTMMVLLSKRGDVMNIQVIKDEINNPALKELASAILETVEAVKDGKKEYNQALAELAGFKQVIQIMALEVMRKRLPLQIS